MQRSRHIGVDRVDFRTLQFGCNTKCFARIEALIGGPPLELSEQRRELSDLVVRGQFLSKNVLAHAKLQ